MQCLPVSVSCKGILAELVQAREPLQNVMRWIVQEIWWWLVPCITTWILGRASYRAQVARTLLLQNIPLAASACGHATSGMSAAISPTGWPWIAVGTFLSLVQLVD